MGSPNAPISNQQYRRKDSHHRDGEESWQKILKWFNYNQGEAFLGIIGNISRYNLTLEEARENLGIDSIVAQVVGDIGLAVEYMETDCD